MSKNNHSKNAFDNEDNSEIEDNEYNSEIEDNEDNSEIEDENDINNELENSIDKDNDDNNDNDEIDDSNDNDDNLNEDESDDELKDNINKNNNKDKKNNNVPNKIKIEKNMNAKLINKNEDTSSSNIVNTPINFDANNKIRFKNIKTRDEFFNSNYEINYDESIKTYENINQIFNTKNKDEVNDKNKKNKKNTDNDQSNNMQSDNKLNSGANNNDSIENTSKHIIKKGPGRPRKTPKKEPSQRKGISTTPIKSDNHIEFLYDQPIIFKKLSQFFKLMASKTLQVIFRKTDIIIYTPDHHQKSKIRVKIDTSKLNLYYIKENTDIGIMTKYLEMIFNKVDKDYTELVIISNVGETQKTINLVLNNDMQVRENHTIELVGDYDKMENENEFINENYTIKLDLPGKYFKKIINDIKTMSNELSICQNTANSPLVIGYVTQDRKIRSEHYINNNNKIKLKSYLQENKSFRANLKIDYIKPISSAQLNDNIQWFIDENRGSMIKTVIDNGVVEIKIITEIIDERNETLED